MSRRQKIHQTLSEHFVPETGVFGDVWLAKAEQSFWYATRDGRVVNLSDVLNQVPAHTPPRHGKDGCDGRTGPRGEAIVGAPGRDGRDGKDSTIPGPVSTVPGPAGPKGEIGPQGRPGPDSATVLAAARAEIASLRSAFADLSLQVRAVREMNSQAEQYLEYLKTKVAARKL
jgi:hypothetical protein